MEEAFRRSFRARREVQKEHLVGVERMLRQMCPQQVPVLAPFADQPAKAGEATAVAGTLPAYPSYMRTQVCGEGTDYACPSREWVPIPHRGGNLALRPDDPRLPQEVRDAQRISKTGDPYARK